MSTQNLYKKIGIQLRNGQAARKLDITINSSKRLLSLLETLKKQGYNISEISTYINL